MAPMTVNPAPEEEQPVNPMAPQTEPQPAPDPNQPEPQEEYVSQPDTPEPTGGPPPQERIEPPAPFPGAGPSGQPSATDEQPSPTLSEPKKPTWETYAVQAIHGLYPHMRRGIDFEFGGTLDDPTPRMLHWDEKYAPADMGEVQRVAEQSLAGDPYANYEAKPGLHQGQTSGFEQGERHSPTQSAPQPRSAPAPQNKPFDPTGGYSPPPDPYFDKDGNRIKPAPEGT